MFKNFFKSVGYDDSLELKNKSTYIINILSIILVLIYSIFYVTVVKSLLVNTLTLLCLIDLSLCFVFLKKRKFVFAKALMLFGFSFQLFSLVFLWFPKETHFNYYFFVIAPISFFIYDFEEKRERNHLIFVNLMAVMLLFSSEIVDGFEYIKISSSMVTIFGALSALSTLSSITLVYFFYATSLSKTHNELSILANTDSLTNISNRRVFFEKGETIFNSSKLNDESFSLLIFDIDHFKHVNDTYGHPIGDQVLIELTSFVKSKTSKKNIFSRYGGEEFALLLLDDKHHFDFAENLKNAINDYKFNISDEISLSITVSIGLATYHHNYNNFEDLVKSADTALYKAKENGRNQVITLNHTL